MDTAYGSGGISVEQTEGNINIRNNNVNISDIFFIATTVNKGPPLTPQTTDFTDERYWIVSIYPYINTAGSPSDALKFGDGTQTTQFFHGYATNLAEAPNHTHTLPTGTITTQASSNPTVAAVPFTLGTIVYVRGVYTPAVNGGFQYIYYFNQNSGIPSGTLQYTVCQMTTQNKVGFDFARGHS